jgi:hypothetical protein
VEKVDRASLSDDENRFLLLLNDLLHGACALVRMQTLSIRYLTLMYTAETVHVWRSNTPDMTMAYFSYRVYIQSHAESASENQRGCRLGSLGCTFI